MKNPRPYQPLSAKAGCQNALGAGQLKRAASKFTWLIFTCASLFAAQVPAAELDCLVKPEMYVEVSSPVISVLEEVLVEAGDLVTRGQPLAKLEATP